MQVLILSNLFLKETSLKYKEAFLDFKEVAVIVGIKHNYQAPLRIRLDSLMIMVFDIKSPPKTDFPPNLP